MIPLVTRDNIDGSSQWNIILTKRAVHLKHHAGEISFPGGRRELSDSNLIQTALRESHEEIGIQPEAVKIIGRLPKQKTISQYLVTPFVAKISSNSQLKLDKNEVESAFEIPLNFALNKANHQQVKQTFNRRDFYFYVIHYHQYRIWGATARMLVNLSYRLNPSQEID
ncbi:MAG: CoA pyrophosphatase [Enterobacterales bacterium]|nr:CoA pyrophosphatase [Enterobacterales bacterium]